MARDDERVDGKTAFGSRRDGVQGWVAIETGATVGKPSILSMDAVNPSTGAVTTCYLWFDSAGELRTSTTFPTTPETDGGKVGAQ